MKIPPIVKVMATIPTIVYGFKSCQDDGCVLLHVMQYFNSIVNSYHWYIIVVTDLCYRE